MGYFFHNIFSVLVGLSLANVAFAEEPRIRAYLWAGRPIAEYSGDRWEWPRKVYDPVVLKYPRLETCPKKPMPSGQMTLDWAQYRKVEEVEVCMFNMIDQMQNLPEIKSWSLEQGFDNWFEPPTLIDGAHFISASWLENSQEKLLPNYDRWFFDRSNLNFEMYILYDDRKGLRSLRFQRGPANYW